MNDDSMQGLKKIDWLIAAALAALAALLYFPTMASFAYPGESAHLQVLWRGLDPAAAAAPYPLTGIFARLTGAGNVLAPLCGLLATAAFYLLVASFVRRRVSGDETLPFAVPVSRAAGIVGAVIFFLSPAVRSAATHLEPRLFALTWALLSLLVLVPTGGARGWKAAVGALAFGALWGAGAADSILFVLFLPLVLAAVGVSARARSGRVLPRILLALAGFLPAFFLTAGAGSAEVPATCMALWGQLKAYRATDGWLLVLLFATVPFLVSLASSARALRERGALASWVFHLAMGVFSILAVATPLSPASVMRPAGVLPVAASAFAAFVAAYLIAYWLLAVLLARPERAGAAVDAGAKTGRIFGLVAGGVLAVVYLLSLLFGLLTYETRKGDFADRLAAAILDDLGGRTWFVSDGSLDDHLRLLAQARGRELNLISLNRDLDKGYLAALTALVKEKKLGGARVDDLALSLSLGVMPFVQDLLSGDSASAASVAVFGAPDLLYAAGRTPVPEFLFFGSDESRRVDWSRWNDIADALSVEKGWGSYRLYKVADPVERKRLDLRRHVGFVANNRGVWLQDQGKNDEAYALYARVLDEIDRDNVCALFNLFEMAQAKHPKAQQRRNELEQRLKAIVSDPARRYRLWSLSTYYGYIRSPEMLIRLGFTWARSGRPGEALSHIRRAVDFIPSDRRSSVLNMMASLYASDDNREKSREYYEKVLAKNAKDRDALVGMMRLSMMEGDNDKARLYLERATELAGDDPRVRIEKAMLAMMKQDLPAARALLKQATDAEPGNLRAWSLQAAVAMQQIDASKDPAERKRLELELENVILRTMEKQARTPDDYYVQSTRAFLLMRKARDAQSRRAARDAFEIAAKARPDIAATQDIVMGLDISLDDTVAAERHARDVLRRNRQAPLANYVMGSLALRRNDYDAAQRYLHKAADAKKPVVLAMNDLAEVYRRRKEFPKAERYARLAVEKDPSLYVAWETIGSVLMDAKGNLDEAQRCIEKACELSKVNGRNEDVRMLISLARVQVMKGDKRLGRMTLRKVQSRLGELSEYEKGEYDRLMKDVR
jgi:tetratricopeptide (TPR) repeat protein